jgi:N-methylhydantoinase A
MPVKRIAVDMGGTFTDLVYIDDETREVVVGKARSTPQDIGQAVIDVVKKVKVDLSNVAVFINGTTAGLNAIAQRKGSKVGLLTTHGFIDILDATGQRKELYNYLWKKPEPLVPRYLRIGIHERMSYRGEVLEPLNVEDIKEAVKNFQDNHVEAVAVCLLHSYINPEHEQKMGQIIHDLWPDVVVSLSYQVARQMGEYERMTSTVISAYMSRAIMGYLSRLDKNLQEEKFQGQLLVLGPNGVVGSETVRENLLYTLASGTVGGAAGAAHLARLCGIKDLVTMDVGGTSFDVSVIKDGTSLERHRAEIMGFPLLMSGIDVNSIGAGGGSLARVDAAGLLTVGPESAGANPGPMAYGKGGQEPTVTDAAVVNGLIDPDYFLGGEIHLNVGLAIKGVTEIARKLGISLNKAADGILAVARYNMTAATTERLISQGYDPRGFTIMSFGGGGGIFAGPIARDMSIQKVIIPTEPGVFCARGILTMDMVHSYTRAYARSLGTLEIDEMKSIFIEMEKEALKSLLAEGMKPNKVEFHRALDMGYEFQHHYLETPVPGGVLVKNSLKAITEAFERLHENRYGHRIQAPLVCVNIHLKAVGKIKEVPVREIKKGSDTPYAALKTKRRVYLDNDFTEAHIFERGKLLWGNIIRGPAIVEEPYHTTLVTAGQTLEVDRWGNLVIQVGGK